MSAITRIISDISATGAQFVISESGVGLDRQVSSDLLALAKQHKDAIRAHLLVDQGRARLAVAARGLPISIAELETIFRDDLEDFGSGAVKPEGIRQACEWYARRAAQ